jgi:hypothetical protein
MALIVTVVFYCALWALVALPTYSTSRMFAKQHSA